MVAVERLFIATLYPAWPLADIFFAAIDIMEANPVMAATVPGLKGHV